MRLASTALALTLLVPAVARAQSSPPTFPRPLPASGSRWDGLNLLLTRERLRDLEAAIAQGDELAKKACDEAIAAADAALGQQPNPIVGELKVPGFYTSQREVQQRITAQLRGDARAAYALAWGHALTGRADYADAAKRFLFAWADALTKPVDGPGAKGIAGIEDWLLGEDGGDTALVTHYSFPLFLYAYDILNGFGRIDPLEKARFKRWLAPFVSYRLGEERFVNNHQCWQVLFMGCAAHVTEDQHLLDMAVAYYRDGMHHQQIAADGAMWRELARSEKAATYTLMALEAMVQFVVIADNHGVHDLRDVVADKRKSTGTDSFQLSAVTHLHSSGVASAGGNLRAAFDSLRDFLNDPRAWDRFQNVIRSGAIDHPANAADWGWIFEVGSAWFRDPSYAAFLQAAPFGLDAPRVYTLGYATLLFRPFLGAAPTSAAPVAPVTAPARGGERDDRVAQQD
jgi:hypothetical protein